VSMSCEDRCTLSIYGCELVHNNALLFGGSLSIKSQLRGLLQLQQSIITSNDASIGGAAYFSNLRGSISDVTWSHNHAMVLPPHAYNHLNTKLNDCNHTCRLIYLMVMVIRLVEEWHALAATFRCHQCCFSITQWYHCCLPL
jgi:hypothetical protein